MKSKRFLVDGRFLESMATGVDRYAFETIKELDKICGGTDISILVPDTVKNAASDAAKAASGLKNIRVIYAKRTGMWTQGIFAFYALKMRAVPVNLCNEVSVLAPDGIVCLHDTCYADCPEFFPKEETEWFLKIYGRIARKAKVILTVSEFSKERITKVLGVSPDRVVVAGNGWQHFEQITPNEYIFDRLKGVEKGQYYFTLSSANKNKNIDWVVQAAQCNPKDEFVIGGRNLERVVEFNKYPNVHYAGAVTDDEAKALMKYCKAFLFPSWYEGFGIPPLEAMSTGAQVVISDRASLPEVFGKSAHYIQPDNPMVHFESLLNEKVEGAQAVLGKYSWAKTAGTVLQTIAAF